jgi:hypothetical protein
MTLRRAPDNWRAGLFPSPAIGFRSTPTSARWSLAFAPLAIGRPQGLECGPYIRMAILSLARLLAADL